MVDPDAREYVFRRRLDGLAYRFRLAERSEGRASWRRIDADLILGWTDRLGWIVGDQEGAVLSRPWEIGRDEQGWAPPMGIWVSRKGDKSYVYTLELADP